MSRVFLPTLDAPPRHGGVARYIGQTLATFGDRIELLVIERFSYWELLREIVRRRKEITSVWTHHVLPIGTVCFVANIFFGVPYVIFLHGLDFAKAGSRSRKKFMMRLVLSRAQAIVTNSAALRDEIAAFAGVVPRVVYPSLADTVVEAAKTVRPPAPGLQKLSEVMKLAVGQAVSAAGASVAFLSSAPQPLQLLTVARLVPRKGHHRVIELLPELPEVNYVIVGSGPEETPLRELAQRLQVEDRVTFVTDATDEEVFGRYRAADVFVMPVVPDAVDREGFGTVYIEANAFGVPVVATRIPGVDEAVLDGETGLLIDDFPESLKEALVRLSRDSALRARLGARGRERALQSFSREAQQSLLSDLL